MIKFIYQVCEEAVIGFSFFETDKRSTYEFNGEQGWYSRDEFMSDFAEEQMEAEPLNIGDINHFLDLIPKDWNKVKFKQV